MRSNTQDETQTLQDEFRSCFCRQRRERKRRAVRLCKSLEIFAKPPFLLCALITLSHPPGFRETRHGNSSQGARVCDMRYTRVCDVLSQGVWHVLSQGVWYALSQGVTCVVPGCVIRVISGGVICVISGGVVCIIPGCVICVIPEGVICAISGGVVCVIPWGVICVIPGGVICVIQGRLIRGIRLWAFLSHSTSAHIYCHRYRGC